MDDQSRRLLVVGLGYSGAAIARDAAAAGIATTGTARDLAAVTPPAAVAVVPFANAAPAIAQATHLVMTAPPGEFGDPLLAAYGAAIAAAPHLRWIGYLSTTGVYGDRAGAWVDEATLPAPGQDRSRRRLDAEQAWAALAATRAVDLFRTGGIYGPGRGPFDELRAGGGRRVIKPGHAFSRIHRDDIALAVVAASRQDPPAGVRVFHLVDDAPAESALVTAEAARLLGVPPPPAVPYAEAAARMSPMARSFWMEDRRVANAVTKATLGIAWRYPTYREGLAAILAEERGHNPFEQGEVGRA